MSRPLGELEVRASAALLRVSQETRERCIDIAREKSPSATFDLARKAASILNIGELEALGIAKATRWLAVILRDHGMEEFNRVVGTLTAISTPKS